MARILVVDNGPGIDEADIPSIFQIFASTKGSSGTGLGLPVSQKIIREHGGKIVVQSRLGQGATFVIELPMSRDTDSADRGRGADDDRLSPTRVPIGREGGWVEPGGRCPQR